MNERNPSRIQPGDRPSGREGREENKLSSPPLYSGKISGVCGGGGGWGVMDEGDEMEKSMTVNVI